MSARYDPMMITALFYMLAQRFARISRLHCGFLAARTARLTSLRTNRYSTSVFQANVAQLVEQIIRNDQVVRSIRIVGSIFNLENRWLLFSGFFCFGGHYHARTLSARAAALHYFCARA